MPWDENAVTFACNALAPSEIIAELTGWRIDVHALSKYRAAPIELVRDIVDADRLVDAIPERARRT